LAQAVSKVNEEMDRPRVTFVKIDFPAAYSFAAQKTRLWGLQSFTIQDGAPLPVVWQSFYCRATMKCASKDLQAATRFIRSRETIEQRKDREALRFLCRCSALGHPKGASLYADAITKTLSSRFK
jgi:hypothetical protein